MNTKQQITVIEGDKHMNTKPQTAGADGETDDDAGSSKPTGNPSFKGAGQNPIRTALPEKPGTIRK